MARKKVEKLNNKNSILWQFLHEEIEPEAERRVIAIAEIVKILVEVCLLYSVDSCRIMMIKKKLTSHALFRKPPVNTVLQQLQKYYDELL